MSVITNYSTLTSSIEALCGSNSSRVFRRAYIKRKQLSDGLFESSWQEITDSVVRWGSIISEADIDRYGSLNISGTNIIVDNSDGKFNVNTSDASLWYGYADQQRTLVKIECGYYLQYRGTDLIWRNTVYPSDPTVFVGVMAGNIRFSESNEVTIPLEPLTRIFKDTVFSLDTSIPFPYPIVETASDFIPLDSYVTTYLRDGIKDGVYIYRPFFNNTTSHWDIGATPTISGYLPLKYEDRTTDISDDLSVWDYLQNACQIYNKIAYIDRTGKFVLKDKTPLSTTAFHFAGGPLAMLSDGENVIKRIHSYGVDFDNYYSRLMVTIYNGSAIVPGWIRYQTETTFDINSSNTSWNYGSKLLEIQHLVGNTSTVASITAQIVTDIVSEIYDYVSVPKRQIEFTSTLVPHLTLFDRVNITYDSSTVEGLQSLWDINNWDTELMWAGADAQSISLNSVAHSVVSIEIDLDNLETKFICREI